MAHHRIAALALASVTALALTGCAGAAAPAPAKTTAAAAPSTGAAPATGDVIAGTNYRYAVPEGWGDPGPIDGFDPDSFAADLDDADGFSDNINVVLSPAGLVTADQVETLGAQELTDAGAQDVAVQPRVPVAGSEAAHLSASLASGDTAYDVEQYYVNDDEQTYVVTFSFSPTVTDADREAVTGPVLASWQFTG